MPSHTIHSALTQMYHDVDGAPWKFAEWRELTGVHHGLFPNADHQLPAPWTRQTAIDISSYFDQFRAITTAPERIKFASQSPRKDVQLVPGRKAWRDWVTKLWKDRKVHEKIIDVLLAENIHPFYLLAQDPSGGWPDANLWLSGAIDPVGTLLFGEEALFQGLERLHSKLRPTTKELIQRTWMLLNNVRHRSERRLSALESKAIQAFEDLDRGKLTKKKIQTVLIKVMKWKQLADAVEILYCPDERIEEMKEELDTLMAGLGLNVKTPRKKTKLCRVTRAMLESLATEEDVSDVLDLYRACFDSSSGDTSVFELPTYECGGFAEEANLGVEIESTLSPDDMVSGLLSDPFAKSVQPPSSRIILVTHSALTQDYSPLACAPEGSAKGGIKATGQLISADEKARKKRLKQSKYFSARAPPSQQPDSRVEPKLSPSRNLSNVSTSVFGSE